MMSDGDDISLSSHSPDSTQPIATDKALGQHLQLLSDIVERSSIVAVTWRNAPGWPLDYASSNIIHFGYQPEDFTSGRIHYADIVHPHDHILNERQLMDYLQHGPDEFEQSYRLRHGDGHWIWIEDHTWLIRNSAGEVTEIHGVLMDVTERKCNEALSAAQWRLIEFAERHDIQAILRNVLDEAERLTESTIGFYHFVDQDQNNLTLQAWSTHTQRGMCKAEPECQHYPIAEAGVWVDAVSARQPIIHNDYNALLHKKGLPDGHVPVVRELVVPVIRGDKIVAILGVGNKPDYYRQQDVTSVQKLADFAWEIVRRKQFEIALKQRTKELEQRTEELSQSNSALKQLAAVFTYAQEGVLITAADGNILNVNAAFCRITGYQHAEVIGQNPRLLQSGRHPPEFYMGMWNALINIGHWQGEIWNRRKNGEVYPQSLTISAVEDTAGSTRQYVAIFNDISVQKERQGQLEHIAHYDPLTGLPNRSLLADRLKQAMALSARHGTLSAVAFVDLDGFKAINDQHGHDVGDRLLCLVAERMQQGLRQVDTIARLGGDEFVAILLDLPDMETCIPMLIRLLKAASEPMVIRGMHLSVSASLGVTFYPQSERLDADQLLRQADHAMYEAKLAGKNRYRFFDGNIIYK